MQTSDKIELLHLLEEKKKRHEENKLFYFYFQPNTPFSIEHYKKHWEFFLNGLEARQRLLLAANRIGKTESGGGYETACHAVGWYPSFWPGKKIPGDKNLTIWVCGDTKKTVRDILQKKFLGDSLSNYGTGLIPKKYINRFTRASGAAETVDTIYIDRIGGGTCQIVFKSYDSGRDTFQGTEVDIILLDEEPPLEVYTECLLRTMTGNGFLILTFTPLMGMTELIDKFTNATDKAGNKDSNRLVTTATWDDVPHLSKEQKDELWASIPEFQRDARSKGIPQLGSGAIYRISLDDVVVEPFEIPSHWKRVYSLDVGWNRTACLWGAINPDNDILYIYDELYETQKQPYEYARMIKQRGEWMRGVVDSASGNANQHDGHNIYDMLISEGLKLQYPNKSVEAGILKVWEGLTMGKIKFFKRCSNLQDEYKVYRRDEKGKIVKVKDHLMDCLRYLVMSGLDIATSQSGFENKSSYRKPDRRGGQNTWMG